MLGAWIMTKPMVLRRRSKLFLLAGACLLSTHALPAEAAGEASPAASNTLEELIVTADKRTANVQDVPASINVLTARQLEAINAVQLVDYAALIPGFQVDTRGVPGTAQLTLRGVAASPSAGATVGTYIDDSPLGSSTLFAQASSFSLDLMPYDIERIEVLEGPQGTLYGASSMGGLLKYVLKSPDLKDFSGQVGVTGFGIQNADEGGYGGRLALNMPLVSDTLALRVSLFGQRTPGYVNNVATGEHGANVVDQGGGRIALLWQASSAITVKLDGLFQDIDAKGSAAISAAALPRTPVGLTAGPAVFGDLTASNIVPTPFRQTLQFYSATVTDQLGWADLLSATSFSRSRSDIHNDFSGTFGAEIPQFCGLSPACSAANPGIQPGLAPLHTTLDLDKLTEEVRLTSPSGRTLEWIVGAFYTNERIAQVEALTAETNAQVPIASLNPLGIFFEPSTYREYAAFGDVTYHATDKLSVTAGLRWAHNDQSSTQNTTGFLLGDTAAQGTGGESTTTFLVNPKYQLTPDIMVYARVASGYRPGGPNLPFPGVPPKVNSDSLVNYEVGAKSELLDKRLILDAAVFYIDWRDIQVVGITPDGINYNTNGGTAVSQGVELSGAAIPLEGLRLDANLAFTDAKLTADIPSLGGLSGDRLPLSPRWSAAAGASYDRPIVDGWTGHAAARVRYVGDRYSEVESSPTSTLLKAYTATDLQLGASSDRWTVSLFARNIFDRRGYLSTLSDRVGANLGVDILQPRTVGLSLDRSF
jgi:iron complex outermembrane recepter protein